MTRFVHTADWQLGMTRHFLSAEAQARFDGARLDVVRAIGALAVEQRCGFVVVCGDVFETNHVRRQIVVRALEAMGATPSITFYLLPGNHDPLDAASVMRSRTFVEHCPPNVVVLTDGRSVPVAEDVEIVAAPWTSKRPVSDLTQLPLSAAAMPERIRILVAHGAVDALTPESSDPALISLAGLEEAIGQGRVHYVALGDRHSTTDVGTTRRVWYSGTPEPTDYDETDPGNTLIVDLDESHCEVIAHHVGSWRYLRHDVDVAGRADCDRLGVWLSELPDKERTILKVAVVGQLSLADATYLDEILEHHTDLLGALERCQLRTDLVVLPDDDDFDSLGLSGFAAGALIDLREAAGGRDDSAIAAADALALLYRLARVPA